MKNWIASCAIALCWIAATGCSDSSAGDSNRGTGARPVVSDDASQTPSMPPAAGPTSEPAAPAASPMASPMPAANPSAASSAMPTDSPKPASSTPPSAAPVEAPFLPDLTYSMTGRIDAGAEAMFCMYIQMPLDQKTAIPSAESHYTPGSHHFLAFRTTLTEIPPGEDVSHLCGEPGETIATIGGKNGLSSGESSEGNNGSYYEAQVPNARRDLPPGVAHVFEPGEIMILTAHYFNVTDVAIDSTIEFRLHRMDPEKVEQEAGTFFLLNTQLNIPARMEVTTTRNCPIPSDINLGLLWSHMHARGHSFRAWTDDPTAAMQLGGDVYSEPGPEGWEDPHVQIYPTDPPITLHAGTNLMISCTYRNETDQAFKFGLSAATAEMCLLHGMYWPRLDSATERCTNGKTTSEKPVPLGTNE